MLRINESNYDLIKKVMETTRYNININWQDAKNINGFIEDEDILDMIDVLLYEIEHLKDEYRDLEKDLEENYRPIPYSEQVCVYDSDFI